MHILHLMTYKSSGAPGFGIRPVFRTYVVNLKNLHLKLLSFYLTFLDLLDITSQRKLAHIQRLILLNFHFKSITDLPVGTFPLAICDQSVLPVPKLFYFIFIFFQNTTGMHTGWKNTYTWFSHQDLQLYNSHMDTNDNLAC